jgi:hypothetical protein
MRAIAHNPGLCRTVRDSTIGAVVVIISCALAVLALTSQAASGLVSFNIEVVDGNGGTYGSIAIDSQDRPHVSYYSPAGVKYAFKSGGAWSIELVDAAGGPYTSIVLDANDQPYIAYSQDSQADVRLAWKTAGAWTSEIVDGDGGANVGGASLGIDAVGGLHVAYTSIGGFNDVDLMYAYKTGGTWTRETADSTVTDDGQSAVLDVDAAGNPHIVHETFFGIADGELRYAWKSGGVWTREFAAGLNRFGRNCSFALDSQGAPHVTYYLTIPPASDNSLRYATRTGGTWSRETADASGNVGQYSSIALDSMDQPHVAYRDNEETELRYAIRAVGAWNIQEADDAGDVGRYPALALDSTDRPRVIYYDLTNGDLKYAEVQSETPVSGLPYSMVSTGLAAQPNPFGQDGTTFVFRVPTGTSGARISVFDMTGRRVRMLALDGIAPDLNNAVWNGRDDSGSHVAAAVYFARLSWNGAQRASARVTIVR